MSKQTEQKQAPDGSESTPPAPAPSQAPPEPDANTTVMGMLEQVIIIAGQSPRS